MAAPLDAGGPFVGVTVLVGRGRAAATARSGTVLDIRERPAIPDGPYLVAGVGRAGLSAIRGLRAQGASRPVVAWDERPKTSATTGILDAMGVDLLDRRGTAMEALDGATVIKSPGVPFTAPPLRLAARLGLPVLDELELGWRLTEAPVIAVTGTNGKSTTSGLIADALAASDVPVALAGNVDSGPPMSAVASRSPRWIVSEVSSYQLEGAPGFLPEVAVFTNLSHDHLHRHGDMRRYGEVKRRMFVRDGRCAGTSVINVDDRFGRLLAQDVEARGGTVVRYGRAHDADYRLEGASWTITEGRFRLATPGGRLAISCSLPGWHNGYNVAAAMAVAESLSLDRAVTVAAIGAFSPLPGRSHAVEEGQPFDVVVDVAHSPASVRAVLVAARRILRRRRSGSLLVVSGAAGGRLDPTKRYSTGWQIGRLADRYYLTTADAYGAGPGPGLAALAAGAASGGRARVEVEVDRWEAIRRALRAARSGDIVGLLGRGANDRLILDRAGLLTIPFDDASVASDVLRAVP